MAYYLDTSALAKLVIPEAETVALQEWLRGDRQPVVADLARTELQRAVRRYAPAAAVLAAQVLDAVTIIALAPATFDAAGRLEPVTLRSLDALHLAAALELGDELDGFVTYDDRLADAARAYGIAVVAPGRDAR